ncbi:HD domain-containing protein [Paenibacillus sp. J5C_2022]|uniref:HD domain-containing protein n=1 Tax=Paenibacillus sp. J5C2022 TaxID=2977129 RepID=UPI0021D33B01|nr:HD domain-containing protein [Paenibacillus sp. J5C2022]MCU6710186.1 HD domain-containing protein [Paenibacillus sp. J5C2022]
MSNVVADIKIPDSKLALGAAELLREYGNDLLWNHSHRVFLFGALQGIKEGVSFSTELLYISALFHDLGLVKQYSSSDKRFEVDGANAARDYLKAHGVPAESIRLVWDAIALHTTIGIAQYKEPEVMLIYSGVGYDVMGENFDSLTEEMRKKVTTNYPRDNFKQKILSAFYDGFKHKQETTFGNIKADVCSLLNPDFKRKNFCECVLHSPWIE